MEIFMNRLNRSKNANPLLLIALVLVCFALMPRAQAAPIPAPDGGYPNQNTAEGDFTLVSLSSGAWNSAVGFAALNANSTGSYNTGTGAGALYLNSDGIDNTATGFAALSNCIGSENTAVGSAALLSNGIGSFNTAVGTGALLSNTRGNGNIALGAGAGNMLTTGDDNIEIGNKGVAGEFSTIRIGDANQLATYIAGISGKDAAGGDPVFITSNGKLGTVNPPSAARFKEEMKPMNQASEVLFALKPVTFRYKKEFDPKRIPQFGLVAEEVEKVNPDLVKRDRDGNLQTVRYDAVNAMLLNEFLKEHHQVQNLKSIVAGQQKQIDALTAGLQKVSAQLEMSKPAPQVVNNQ